MDRTNIEIKPNAEPVKQDNGKALERLERKAKLYKVLSRMADVAGIAAIVAAASPIGLMLAPVGGLSVGAQAAIAASVMAYVAIKNRESSIKDKVASLQFKMNPQNYVQSKLNSMQAELKQDAFERNVKAEMMKHEAGNESIASGEQIKAYDKSIKDKSEKLNILTKAQTLAKQNNKEDTFNRLANVATKVDGHMSSKSHKGLAIGAALLAVPAVTLGGIGAGSALVVASAVAIVAMSAKKALQRKKEEKESKKSFDLLKKFIGKQQQVKE